MATAFIALKHFQAKMPGDGSARFELCVDVYGRDVEPLAVGIPRME